MSNFVITIARQYGSGGRTIGQMFADKMGISFYDKDIIRRTSDESGVNIQLFHKVDENSTGLKTGGFLSKAKGLYTGNVISPSSRDFTSDDNLFNLQAQTIKHLAEEEACVIIGRCSNYILRDYPHVLSVFIHASMDYRLEKAAGKLSMTEKEIVKFLQKDDKRKEDFSMRYTGKRWTDATGYDLCLDSSKLGYDKCVEEIEAYLKIRFPEL
ncbi:MAG: cytidylate kinase-like family protein [Eubacteriales bacterium]|nr:cytidylate kinase-like family protein [Eubacteriales bacterium]